MKVLFEHPTSQIAGTWGLQLDPGENEVPDEVGEQMIACGLVKRVEERRPAPKRTKEKGEE